MPKDNEKSHIERLKEKLYSPKSKDIKEKPRSPVYEDPHEVTTSWPKEPVQPVRKKRKNLLENTMFRKFFFGTIIFFVLAMAFGFVMFFNGRNTVSAENIEINVLGNAFTSGGEELPLKIQISNRNNVSLEYCDLLLEYQKGAGIGENIQRDRFTVGTIPAGGRVDELINLVIFGQQGTTRDVNITLEYRVKGSSAIFVKQELYVVNISSTPVNLLIDGPEVTNTNQNISFSIETSLNTENAIKDMMVVVDYPPGFDFKSANPEPTFSNNIWSLGDLSKGTSKKITINGVVIADAGEKRAFNIYTGTALPKNEQKIGTQFNSEDYIITVEKPFLDIRLLVNGNGAPETTTRAGEIASGVIEFQNNLETKITDVEVTARFSGNAFSPPNVTLVNGFYDLELQTLIWNSQTGANLSSIEPGQKGSLNFNFKPIPFSGTNIKNPEINIEVSVKGRQPSQGNAFQEINNFLQKKVKFGTDIQISGHALYNSGPITNSGPLPPTPGSSTTYTIFWSVTNSLNKVVNAKVRTVIPIYVDWTGIISPQNQNVSYNSSTREIIWDVGSIDAGVGQATSPRQVYFQLRLNPSGSQSGTSPNLILETSLSAKDSFAGSDIVRNMSAISTRLYRDSNYNLQNDKVQ